MSLTSERHRAALAGLVVVASIVGACTTPAAAPGAAGSRPAEAGTGQPVQASAPSVDLDCAAIVLMSPQQAGEAASAAGLAVNWRLQHTLPDGTTVADIVGSVPDGTVIDLMVADGQALIFVAPAGDPAARRPDHPSC